MATEGKRDENFKEKSIRLEELPSELLLKIFSFLDITNLLKCSQTSKRIRSICYDDSLWQKINLRKMTVPTEFLQKVIGYGCKSLNLSKANLVGTLRLENESQLTNLDLLGCSATSHVFEVLLKSCTNLQKLQFTNTINVDYQKVLQLKLMPNLKSLFIDCPLYSVLDIEIEHQLREVLPDVSVNGQPTMASVCKKEAYLSFQENKRFWSKFLKSMGR